MDTSLPLKNKIAKVLSRAEKPLSIKEIAEDFVGIPESTIRGRLNENEGVLFKRIHKGVYVLKGEKGTIGLINGDARTLDNKFEPNSVDLILSDHAWLDEKSHTGGNRSFANYECFKYTQHDFDQKILVLKDGGFLIEFLPEKNENNRKYLREIEDLAEKSGFKYFAEVNISGGNSNIGRKKKYVSTAYFFTKGDAQKLKIWDEKLAKDIKTSKQYILGEIKDFVKQELGLKDKRELVKFDYAMLNLKDIEGVKEYLKSISKDSILEIDENNKTSSKEKKKYELLEGFKNGNEIYHALQDEFRIDFKKVYSEVLHVEKEIIIPEKFSKEIKDFLTSSDVEDLIDFHTSTFRKLPENEQKKGLIPGAIDIDLESNLYLEIKEQNLNKIVNYLYKNRLSIYELRNSIFETGGKGLDFSLIENILNDYKDRITKNFDLRITKKEAEYILNNPEKFNNFRFDIMCKEYGEEDDWVGINSDDLDEDENTLDSDYYTFDIFLDPNLSDIELKEEKKQFSKAIDNLGFNREPKSKLQENFEKHLELGELPQFKKIKKQKEFINFINSLPIFPEDKYEEYQVAISEYSKFHEAFNEYEQFLQKVDSYKMGTKTILPEFYMGDLSDLREESQKPKNVLEDMILQTSNEGSVVVEQFARSYVGAEAVINLGEEGKGWRDYFGMEIDKEVFDRNVEHLRNKYKDVKLYTYEDFFREMSEDTIDFINQGEEGKRFRMIEATINKINEDMENILKIELLNFKVKDDTKEVIVENMDVDNNATLLKLSMYTNKSEQNRELLVRINKERGKFEFINKNGVSISSVDNLQEGLIKLQTSRR